MYGSVVVFVVVVFIYFEWETPQSVYSKGAYWGREREREKKKKNDYYDKLKYKRKYQCSPASPNSVQEHF